MGDRGAGERGATADGTENGETGTSGLLGVRKETPSAGAGLPGLGGGRPIRTERRVRISSVKENSNRYLTFSVRECCCQPHAHTL
jgi:hypothetical protein